MEFLDDGYPLIGGQSGNWLKNSFKLDLNVCRDCISVASFGNVFHSLGPMTDIVFQAAVLQFFPQVVIVVLVPGKGYIAMCNTLNDFPDMI